MSEESKQVQNTPAHQPNLQHGVFPFIRSGLHPCNKCVKRTACNRFVKDGDCSYLAEFQKKVEDTVMDLTYVSEHDRPLAQMLAKEMSILALCEMYFSYEGMVMHDKRKKLLESQPLVQTYNNFMRSVKQSMKDLGLGPAVRAKIDLDKAEAEKKLREADPTVIEDEGTDFLDD